MATSGGDGRRHLDGDGAVDALGRVVGALVAQPTCVRAFFLRLASLRLRFTLGFS